MLFKGFTTPLALMTVYITQKVADTCFCPYWGGTKFLHPPNTHTTTPIHHLHHTPPPLASKPHLHEQATYTATQHLRLTLSCALVNVNPLTMPTFLHHHNIHHLPGINHTPPYTIHHLTPPQFFTPQSTQRHEHRSYDDLLHGEPPST